MKFVPIDPPGTWCTYGAVRDVAKRTRARSFIDVGCGGGGVSRLLCSLGMTGIGIDFSPLAIHTAKQALQREIQNGKYQLLEGDAATMNPAPADLCLSVMVMEHVEDDVGFVRTLSRMVKPGGYLAVCVPGRKDCWSFEDETAGHFRRYDREDLRGVLKAGGLTNLQVWSVAVPTANLLLRAGTHFVKRSGEGRKLTLSQREQTATSGVRDIPWKTTFPACVKLVLNPYIMWPFTVLQRLFYGTRYGVTMLGFGQVAR